MRYLHAAAGFPVKDTWLRAIKSGNYATWPGLTYNNAAKYCPDTNAIIMGHMVHTRQGVRSTKPRPKKPKNPMTQEELPRELHVQVRHVSCLCTDNTGRFTI